ncbi:MAG: hypothetical protein R3F46_14595 [bacterium]
MKVKLIFLGRIHREWERKERVTLHLAEGDRWTIGANARILGLPYSTYGSGTAADLATCNMIGVYPVVVVKNENGQQYNRVTRLRFVVSVETPAIDVDIYSPIAIRLQILQICRSGLVNIEP